MSFGSDFLEVILFFAGFLVRDSAPGWVGIGLVAFLLLALVTFLSRNWRRMRAVRSLKAKIVQFEDIPAFARGFDEFRASLENFKTKSKDHEELWKAWDEYQETLVRDEVDGEPELRNSVRPSSFLNLVDLGFGPGFYRNLPSIFVSVGLLLTFLGLVAALHTMAAELSPGGDPGDAVKDLMAIASAKFTMSLVGLACSIVFSVFLRKGTGALERDIHQLCLLIERRLRFVSLEDLGIRQLAAAVEQREHLRKIGMEMVAELSRPLETLPDTISSSISTAMEPMFDKVGKIGTSGMEGIVGDLSNQISHSVGNALSRASETLGEASEKISSMVDRMNAANTQMGSGMESALGQMASAISDLRHQVEATGAAASGAMNEGAERLLSVMNETLAGIRDNTSDGARAMSEAAGEMRAAAEGFRTELAAATAEGAGAVQARMEESSRQAGQAISDAGAEMLAAFTKTSGEIAQLGQDMSGSVRGELMEHLESLAKQFRDMVSAVEAGVGGMRSASNSLGAGADAISEASSSFGGSSRDFVAAVEPVRRAHESIEQALRSLEEATSATSETIIGGSKAIADDARRVLETAQSALGTEREGIRQSMHATQATMARLSEEADKLDDIDEMLGEAIRSYSRQLEEAMGSAQTHILSMRDALAPGLDTLRAVVERAEEFVPASRRA